MEGGVDAPIAVEDHPESLIEILAIPLERLSEHALLDSAELAEFKARLVARRGLPEVTMSLLREVAMTKAPVMDALRAQGVRRAVLRSEGIDENVASVLELVGFRNHEGYFVLEL